MSVSAAPYFARKRKRAPAASGALMVYRAPKTYKRRRTFTAGADRVGGFYGRFSGRGAELKFHDTDIDDAIVAAGGNIAADSVCKIPQGVTEKTRVGRKCTIKSIQWRYRMTLPENDAVGTPGSSDDLRVILYLDKQCNGATATVTGILESDNPHSFMNLAESGRFSILYDKVYSLNFMGGMASDGAGVVSQVRTSKEVQWSKKCNIPLEFSATTGAISEIRSNNIGLLLIGQTGVVGFDSKMRLRFSDL